MALWVLVLPNVALISIVTVPSIVVSVMYFWQLIHPDKLKPRLYWLRAIAVDIGFRIAFANAVVFIVLFSDQVRQLCEAERPEECYPLDKWGNVEESCVWDVESCISYKTEYHNIWNIALFSIQLPMRLWFALNIRDWFKKLEKKQKKQGSNDIELATSVLYFQ